MGAEHMKALSTTEMDESDEDDDDDIMEESEHMPAPPMRGRAKPILPSRVEIPADWTPPVFAKEPAEEEYLKANMNENKLMKSLTPSDRDQLLEALKKVEFPAGSEIIKQGDAGDFFYIVYEGEADITVEGKGVVMKAGKGVSFGELALLHNSPRAATVTATTDVVCFALDMMTFKAILMGKAQKDGELYLTFVESIDLLKPLALEDKKTLASALREKQFPPDYKIVCEGDVGDFFYIILDGEVKCTKTGAAEEVSRRLKKGDFFGELALLSSDKRRASVTTVLSTKVLMLDRGSFNRLLGPLSEKIIGESAKVQDRQ